MSGLQLNAPKSSIFFGGISPTVKTQLSPIMGSPEGTFPIKYLGVPLNPRRLNKLSTMVWSRNLSGESRIGLIIIFLMLGGCYF